MQEHDKAMIARRGDEWMFSGDRLRLQQAESMATYEAMILAAEKSRQGVTMEKEHIKKLAVESGAAFDVLAMGRSDGVLFTPVELERFAQAVARECAKLADDSDYGPIPHNIGGQIRARYGLEG